MSITKKEFYRNPEVIFILLYNLLILISYYYGNLEPIYVLWAYFLQSLYIGARYWFLEIYTQFRSAKKQWFMTLFFPIHYGGFHLAYFVFLIIMSMESDIIRLRNFFLINAIILIIQFIFFVIREVSPKSPYHSKPSLFSPYVRIFPMHIIIILGMKTSKFGINIFYLFILLKTLLDLVTFSWFDKQEIK